MGILDKEGFTAKAAGTPDNLETNSPVLSEERAPSSLLAAAEQGLSCLGAVRMPMGLDLSWSQCQREVARPSSSRPWWG